MSGFVVLMRRDQEAPTAEAISPLLTALEHRGPDGCDVVCRGQAVLGHLHMWTTPEEVGESQPLHDAATRLDIVLDGRLDNRSDLAVQLGLTQEELARLSDAALALRAFQRWQEDCFTYLLGSFALVIFDARQGCLVAGRDPMGNRTVHYYIDSQTAVLASEESALLLYPTVSSRLDDSSLARFFAARAPAPEATFFADIKTLPPGHAMIVGDDHVRRWCYWQLTDQPQPHLGSDHEWVEQMREVLNASVCCRLRALTPPAVLMSGGLDSTSVAALAARQLQETGADQRLVTISWIFDETDGADEREFIEAMISHCRLDARLICGDDGWPLSSLKTWPTNPNLPNQALYRRLTDRAYAAVHQAGLKVMLTGEYGDHLYFGWLYWLRDLLRAGRRADAWRLIRIELGDPGIPLSLRCFDLLRAAVRVVGWQGRRLKGPAWLTPMALDLVGPDLDTEIGPIGDLRRDQARALLDPYNAHSVCLESANASRAGIEVRTPYRDRRLVELALAMPAHLLYRRGWHKWIVREAMRGILPEPVRTRWQETSLAALCMRGLVEQEQSSVARILYREDAIWPQYVRADWLRHTLADQLRISGVAAVVIWSCICMELWRRELC